MMDRQLVEQIVMEVIKKLSSLENQSIEKLKPNLLVVGDQANIDPKLLLTIEANWNLVRFNSLEEIELHTAMKVVFLNAGQDLLVKGALGISDTTESELLSRCLLESVPVTFVPTAYLNEHLSKDHQKDKAYISQLLGYKDALLKFGVKVESLECFVGESKEPILTDSGNVQALKKKKLLTQRDVQVCHEDQLVVDQHTIITPLARDTARELGKSIKVIGSKGAKS